MTTYAFTGHERDAMLASFIETSLRVGTYWDGDDSRPLDDVLDADDIPDSVRADMAAVVDGFIFAVEGDDDGWPGLSDEHRQAYADAVGGDPIGAAGHDLALTREGHGTGFWDRGAGEAGDDLTKIAESQSGEGLNADAGATSPILARSASLAAIDYGAWWLLDRDRRASDSGGEAA